MRQIRPIQPIFISTLKLDCSMRSVNILFVLLGLICFGSACRKSDYPMPQKMYVTDNGNGTGTTTWRANREYVLEGLVYVNDGQVLTIEAGAVIRAKTGQGINATALIVSRGGKIIADGNSQAPIIFTVEGDDLEGSTPLYANGLWGGIIILGNAPLNAQAKEARIEGIPISEPRGVFGGQNPDDNSGILRYVSIRHGGTNIGQGNEINGLTLGGVGSNTTIEYVEVVSNADDGIEFFGGTVNCRYLVSAFCGDDAFDFDMGYSGKGQFWLGIHNPGDGNCIIESDGNAELTGARPFTSPVLANLTSAGRGENAGGWVCRFQNEGGAHIYNSLFLSDQNGIGLEYLPGGTSAFDHWEDGYTAIKNNTFYEVGANTASGIFVLTGDGYTTSQQNTWLAAFAEERNKIRNPGIDFNDSPWSPLPLSPETDVFPIEDTWFVEANYRGAFLNDNWLRDWSYLYRSGYIF